MVRLDALERFLRYCRFDPLTGCVEWIGGTVRGQGKTARYGAFWYAGRAWTAHRWAAQHIHGLDIDGLQVDHCCPPDRAGTLPLLPNTLCVRHLQAATVLENVALRDLRRLWIHTEVGLLEPPPQYDGPGPDAVPFHVPPPWLGVDRTVTLGAECPF